MIVVVAIMLTKGGTSSGAGSTPSTGATTTTYQLSTPKQILKMKLSSSATGAMEGSSPLSKVLSENQPLFKKDGFGSLTNVLEAVYYLHGSSESLSSSAFKGFEVSGYVGSFNPSAIIKYQLGKATDGKMEPAGPHGGEMMCGKNTAGFNVCVWATSTTMGMVTYWQADHPTYYANLYATTLKLRAGLESPVG